MDEQALPFWFQFWICSMARRIQLTLPWPAVCLAAPVTLVSAMTLRLTSLHLGATPEMAASLSRWGMASLVSSSRISEPTTISPPGCWGEVQAPAMMPATWLPWPKASVRAVGSSTGGSLGGRAAGLAGGRVVFVNQRQEKLEVAEGFKVGVGAMDTGVDHGPDDVFASGSKRALGGVGLDGGDGTVDEDADFGVLPDAVDDGGLLAVLHGEVAGLFGEAEDLFAGEAGEAVVGDGGVGDVPGVGAFFDVAEGFFDAALEELVEGDDDVEGAVGVGLDLGEEGLGDHGAHHVEADVFELLFLAGGGDAGFLGGGLFFSLLALGGWGVGGTFGWASCAQPWGLL